MHHKNESDSIIHLNTVYSFKNFAVALLLVKIQRSTKIEMFFLSS